jgi:polyisoprenoid-binding protein YceI
MVVVGVRDFLNAFLHYTEAVTSGEGGLWLVTLNALLLLPIAMAAFFFPLPTLIGAGVALLASLTALVGARALHRRHVPEHVMQRAPERTIPLDQRQRYGAVSLLALFVLAGAATTTQAAAKAGSGSYRVTDAEVTIVCPLTVGGSFEAKSKELRGEVVARADQPGAIDGALHVNLQTLSTGISLRDRHMRDNYLEVQKGPEYATAILEQIRIERLEGATTLKGVLRLHGQRREISGTAALKEQDGRIRVQAQFPLKVSEFEIPKPSYLGVGVRDEIEIKVSMTVVPGAVTQTASAR